MELETNGEVATKNKEKLFGRLMRKPEQPQVAENKEPVVEQPVPEPAPVQEASVTVSNKGELIDLVLSNFSSDEIAKIAQAKLQLVLQGKM